ncbi:DHA2 family efflux MFS transporter permease subunit [Virgisporangium aliadipatigenens]|uniref:DHA2 family efflux MFS transporter permease subunit n=1 Tax=Virgisporangium aliadipatigenens TaxID=741659 RepID=UPI001942AF10|nr:DHA2 family efflux MFS transporter permease subunit [Virgisporangium aliadipatigenens]
MKGQIPWGTAITVASGAFLSGLDAAVVNVGLDTIGRDLDTTLDVAQWVANGYLVAFAASLPACGWLARRLGPARLWLGALAVFTVASGLCAVAGTIGWLVAARVLQGLAAGLLIPAGQTILGRAVGPQRLGRVMATLGVAVTLAPAVGPVVGGVVLHYLSWPWLFLINLPVGLLALLAGRRLPYGTGERPGPLDHAGLLLLSLALPLVVYGAAFTEPLPLALGILCGGAFVAHALRRERPVLDLRLFRTPAYAAACATAACAGAAMFGSAVLFPLYFQLGRGAEPLDAGLLLVSASIGTALVLPVSGRLVDRFGGGAVALAGGLALVGTTVPFAVLDVNADGVLVQALLFLRGAAVALAVMPATTGAFKAVTVEQLPDATTQVNIVTRVGGALGGAAFTLIVASGLASGAGAALRESFGWLTGASVLGVAAAFWLAVAERASQDRPVTVDMSS